MRDSRDTDEVLVCMAQRLQGQLERQLTLVERVQGGLGNREPEPGTSLDPARDGALADLAELRTSIQRTLRAAENLLVLGGAQQSPRARGSLSVAEVLADARFTVEDPARVAVGSAPAGRIAPRAVPGLVALFGELLTHGLAAAPAGTRVEVGSRRSEDGGVVVEVVIEGPGPSTGEIDELNRRLGDRPIIDDIVSNRVGLFVAARLARRCGAGLRLQHRRGGALPATGLVTVVHCPPDLLDVDLTAPATRAWDGTSAGHGGDRPGSGGIDPVGVGRNGHDDATSGNGTETAWRGRPDPLLDPLPADPPLLAPPALPTRAPLPEPGSAEVHPAGQPARTEPAPWDDLLAPARAGDELFGPLSEPQQAHVRANSATPIYEAVASAWFVGDAPRNGTEPIDWSSPHDAEWRAASDRAARPGPEPTRDRTTAGLPRRRPGTQMVAPALRGAPPAPQDRPDRVPDRVRERLNGYQQGLDRGRHRAADPDLGGGDLWS